MQDVRADIQGLWRFVSRHHPPGASGRSIMFVAARCGEGTSSVAASFALLAARKSERVTWLVDLDFARNEAFGAFQAGFADDVGRPGKVFDASLRQKQIYALRSAKGMREARLLTVNEIPNQRLLVTRFRNAHLVEDEEVRFRVSPDWWAALRKSSDWAVVDAPALEVSTAGLVMAPQQDGIILVVEADRTGPNHIAMAKREIAASGGYLLGAVINKVGRDITFLEASAL